MPSYNKVMLMGNVTRDPQIKETNNNTTVCEFGLAINHKWKAQDGSDREDVTFVDCTAFGKTAEFVERWFPKGRPIFVEGRLKYDTWDDKQSGAKRSKLSVVVSTVQFCGGNRGDGDGSEADQTAERPPARRPPARRATREETSAPFGEEQQFQDDDIPF